MDNKSPQGMFDAALVKNKINIASNFTFAIDTPEEASAYSGNAAAAALRGLLSKVTSSTNPDTFQANVDSTLASLGQTAQKAAFHDTDLHYVEAQLVGVPENYAG